MNSVTRSPLVLYQLMKVHKTLYDMWSEVHTPLVHMEVYDYEAYARREALNSLDLKIEMCYLVGEPIKHFG